MLSVKEKRFLRYWEEQRTGGLAGYLLLYALAGTIMISLFVMIFMFFVLHWLFSWVLLASTVAACLIVSASVSVWVWKKNESKWKELIRREVSRHTQENQPQNSDSAD